MVGEIMAYKNNSAHTEANGKVEMIFAVAGNSRGEAMPTGWCDNEELEIGSGHPIRYYDFAAGEYYYEQVHLSHGTDFSRESGLVDFDVHFFNKTSDTGDVVLKISLWHLYPGRVMSGLDTADVTYEKTLTFTDGVANKFSAAYVEDAIDLSAWAANQTPHDGMLYKLERLTTGDTKTGGLGVIHQELWMPDDGTIWNG